MPGTIRTVTTNASATTIQLMTTRTRKLTAPTPPPRVASSRHMVAQPGPAAQRVERPRPGPRSAALRLRLRRRLLHLLAQAQGAHVGPHLVDVGQALVLAALFAHLPPASRRLAVREPDRVLLLVVDHDLVDTIVFFVFGHVRYLLPSAGGCYYHCIIRCRSGTITSRGPADALDPPARPRAPAPATPPRPPPRPPGAPRPARRPRGGGARGRAPRGAGGPGRGGGG